MGWVDEYKKALGDIQSRTGGSSGGGSGGSGGSRGGSGGSTPKYVGAGHEPFYKNAASRNVFNKNYKNTFDAPVSKKLTSSYKKKKKKEEEKRRLFTKGAFEDGYDIGDVTKTILGTAGDVATGVVKGFTSGVEGITDLGMYGVAGVLDVVGKDDSADRLRESTARSQTDQLWGGLEKTADKYSILGEKADSVIDPITNALGYIGMMYATAGIGAAAGATGVGATALSTGTMFASSAGGSMGEAYQGGATDEEAFKHGVMKGAVDAGSELIFGGLGKATKALGLSRGLSSLDDIFAKKLSSKISNHFWKNAVQYGVKASAEGVEEVLAGLGSAVSKKLTYMSDKELSELIKDENLMEQFAVGMASSAIMQSGYVPGTAEGSLREANKTGKDFITGQTQNEQAVIQKELENRIAEAEKDGTKLTNKQKADIEAEVVEAMEKGYISVDTIVEALGGEKYEQYKQAADWESSLQTEYDTLSKEYEDLGQKENPTLKDQSRYSELKEMLPDMKKRLDNVLATSTVGQQKAQLTHDIYQMSKSDRLVESFFENVRTKQKFDADLSKYDEKQKTVVQKAIDSGILNNSRRTHEFVDFIAKVSADKGVLFDFTNNAKLKESGFAVDGKQVNGFVTKDGITLNIDSAKAMNTTVGHEITHVLEGTEFYDSMKQTIFDYAKAKGEYQSRYDSIAEMYKDVKGADIEGELTADLVGDYLFSDSDFINTLSTQNRNVFQKIYDEIKYLCKVVTAGSKEARELERVKKAFEKAYREGGKTQTDTKYSVSETTDGRFVAVVDNDILSKVDTSTWDKTTKKQVQKAASEELKKFSDGFTINGIEFVGNKDARREYTGSNYSEALARKNPDAYLDKMRAASVLDDVISVATNWSNDGYLKHGREDYVDFIRGQTLIMSGNKTYRAVVLAGITPDGKAIFHDVEDVYPETFEIKKPESSTTVSANESPNSILEDSDGTNVPQNGNEVNISLEQNEHGLNREEEVSFSLSNDTAYMDKAISMNASSLRVDSKTLEETKALRERIAARMNDIKDRGLVGLPEDIEGNTYIANSSYDGTEENTTICPRSLASEAFVDAVSEYLGRPLTVEEQIYISQDLQGRSLTPECTYCYVATDRKAYRAFLGEYVAQRDAVLQKVKDNPNADVSRSGELYKEFLNGRKDTSPMYSRFKMWVDAYKNGKPMIDASHLANINKLMGDINSEFGAELKPQITDAMKYAQSASWAKKRVNYVAYNGHILKWKQDRINKLNSHYGLRMYSFSDFHPAFVLENMQMITDASVRGLKMLGYTKDTDFVDIFAPSGMNINISTFGFESGGNVFENNLIGAEWEKAKALREQYPNVGITFVATNDTLVNWALDQDWIDVVIPFHLVRTGREVAKAFNYHDYTSESSDTKTKDWKKGDKKYIAPTEHNNDKATYLTALESNHLKPRFERFLENPNYMKLVNECRQPASVSKPVQPVFNEDAAKVALAKLEANGYYQPIGGSVDRMYEIAGEVAEAMTKELAPSMSISDVGQEHKQYGNWNVYAKDILLDESDIAPVAENATTAETESAPVTQEAPIYESNDKSAPEGQTAMFEPVEEKRTTRKEYHQSIIDNIKDRFDEEGFDFDNVLKNAKNLSTWSTVDNTPQRVMEKALGYKEGGILSDITVNKVAQNETEGIKWLNSYVDQLKQISKQYGIKPGSKESSAAQMFAEGFYVNENNEIIRYGDPELIQDFKDPKVRQNIKRLARDPRIRKIYDDTLASINESRTRNLYPEIPRLDNYFLHFRAMNDTFSTLGLPFNPNDIRAKDLPTDLNGVTADLKPGQPYFASANHRTGKRTSFDLLGGVERYLNSAKNQIYHIDDIQTLRALRNYIAETYGHATGLEDLDSLTDAEAEERIKQVYGSHLSTFAKFLNEEANVLAGKTALIDRGIEGIIGRRGITFLNTLNRQVGSNMVGYNVSSSLTNFLPVAQTFAKTNKFDFTKAFAQTVLNKLSGGRLDSFAKDSPVVIRRKGEDRFYRTAWQKMADPGYALMGMVDDISTELIARTKYNEFTRKGMDSQKAHFETDKWVSKLMGDRSLGQQPQLYNSKMLGLVTKFQLEVRNQLDAQFYDTIQETKASNEHIQSGLARNVKTAAQVASTFTQLAVAQHLFGKAFESVAGYNPAFDIIEVLATTFGFDDDEESEDTVLDNFAQGLLALAEDLPYVGTFTGGRVPISEAIPNVSSILKGEDEYGNEIGIPKALWENTKDIAPYYLMPGGYGQAKKTVAGLKMFSDDHPIAGSYTDAGNLRFNVEDTVGNRIKAGVFGQYASENARKYFDQEQRTLNPEQTEIFAGLNIPIEEYWAYRDNLYEFYDVKDSAKEAANADGATDEDIVRNRYFSSVNGDLNDLYEKQKEIAKSDSPNKQQQLREIQNQMADILAKSDYESDIPVSVSGAYAEAGDRRFNYDVNKDFWYEIKEKNDDGSDNWFYVQEKLSHDKLGMSYADFWNGKEPPEGGTYYAEYNGKRYNYDVGKNQWYEITPKNDDGSDNWYYQMEQAVTKGLGISYEEYWSKPKEYNYAYEKPGMYAVTQAIGGYDSYMEHYDALENGKSDNYIGADKDANGNSISGSRKKKVMEYIDGLDLDYGEKIILYRTVYSSKADKRAFNQDIVDYLFERKDISKQQMIDILEELDFKIDAKGYIRW